MSNELIDRNCEKCVHHMNGYCDSWDCNMQTVDDVKREAVNEYIKAVIKELNELDVTAIRRYEGGTFGNYEGTDYYIEKSKAIEIVKAGVKNE